jgi:hypothetical protein
MVTWCWCGCAGAVAVLVLLCWSTRVLGRPVSHTVNFLYSPLSSGVLTPLYMHLVTMLLASWGGLAGQLGPWQIFCE